MPRQRKIRAYSEFYHVYNEANALAEEIKMAILATETLNPSIAEGCSAVEAMRAARAAILLTAERQEDAGSGAPDIEVFAKARPQTDFEATMAAIRLAGQHNHAA